MKQRVPGRAWYAPGLAGRRPRMLVESASEALSISDFTLFQQAGFDVAFCSGPGRTPRACPLLQGQECTMLGGADVVLHGLDPALGIAAAIRHARPDLPIVAEQPPGEDGSTEVPDGCLPLVYPCSVHGQVDAVRRALGTRRG